eukprot:gnl/Spiro4/3853_TR1899_c0_g1_i1.p1 gnl/Spiro4/3853_TR1899_c0_g1~~gnl/Spiro4/3853_TR1899_c0_g1_i1.p1  ORF type:complete len:403 (-),score=63.58 gnl/Spiro4/3853_TR1899_c0_g1_i1:3-1211(-)
MDSCPEGVFVLGATNRPRALDPSVRRAGRFDRELDIGIPTAPARVEILGALLRRLSHTLSPSDIQEVAASCHGYTGADLASLCREAGLRSMRRARAQSAPTNGAAASTDAITRGDVDQAFAAIRPSAMREIVLDVPNVRWDDIGGNEEIKQLIREAVEWPVRHPEAFQRLGIRPPRGVLLYGPPGCSKTLIAKALATESGLNFIAIKGPELFSKWVGESEKAVQEVFRKARAVAPAIVFFDEIDALATKRSAESGGVADRVLSQLLTELDGIEPLKQVVVIAATNRPAALDDALLRPGRFDRLLYVGPPDRSARESIFKIACRKIPLADDVCLAALAEKTNKYSGAEISAICREAAVSAMQEDLSATQVFARHFEAALALIPPRTSDSVLKSFEAFRGRSRH